MTPAAETFSAVRYDEGGKRKGWCSHRHRERHTAEACARMLNRSWRTTGEFWLAIAGGHLPDAETDS